MKKRFDVALLALTLTATCAIAQTKPDKTVPAAKAESTAPVSLPLCIGTTINATLVGELDVEKAKPGDTVTAIATEPVMYGRSAVIPKGTKLVGHVVRSGSDTDGDGASALFLQFDRAIFKNGQVGEMNAGIQALAASNATGTKPENENLMDTPLQQRNNSEFSTDVSTRNVMVVPSTYSTPRASSRGAEPHPEDVVEGGLTPQGKFTPDSKGSFGMDDVKVYTPLSEGSHGTVLMSQDNPLHLANGTKLLLVVQPPAKGAEPDGSPQQ